MNDFLRDFKMVFAGKRGVIAAIVLVVIIAVIAAIMSLGGYNRSIMPNYTPGIVSDLVGEAGGATGYRNSTSKDSAYYQEVGQNTIAPYPPTEPSASTPDLPKDRKVIQNGSLQLLVKDADISTKQISTIATAQGGFVENVNIYEISDGVKSGSLTVRVPVDKFTAVMDEIKKIATKVSREGVNSSDVTAQYVDLEAQIKNYKAEERQYQDIMARAVKIQDVLDVASRLADVRGRIERTQGQLNYLSRQVAMSTISVSLTAEPEVQVFGIVWRPLTVLKQSFKSLLTDLTGFVDWLITFAFKLPIYILRLAFVGLVIWVVWKIIRRIVPRRIGPPSV